MANVVEAASAGDGFAITKSDTTTFAASALYVGTAGDVVLVTFRDTTLTFAGVPAGTFIPVRCKKVMAATTASNIVGLTY